MVVIVAALVVAAAIGWSARTIAAALEASRGDATRARALDVLTAFAPGIGAADADPRALLVWQPLARAARSIFPDEFALLDRASGAAFPFPPDRVQAAHAQWTTEWLSWERQHDAEYKRRAADVEADRAALDLVEREKLDTYQRRYEQYVRVSKALQALSKL